MSPDHQQQHRHLRHRQLDEVDYWRAQAGWVDDAYDPSLYQSEKTTSSTTSAFGNTPDEVAKNVLKLLSIFVALGLSILFFRAIMRRMNSEKERKNTRSDKSRSGSTRRSRSRSRSRKGEYDLMDDGDEKSKRSTRSRSSRSRRSRSRSRTDRSRSKSRSRVDKTSEPVKEAVLV